METALKLVSSEGKAYPITEEMAELSSTLQEMCYATGSSDKCPTVSLEYTKKDISNLVKWMEHYIENKHIQEDKASTSKNSLADWERRFFHSLKNKHLLSLLNLANFLHVSILLNTGASYISEKLTMKTVEEARSYLCLRNDFTVAEEKEIQDRFGWLVEKF